MYGWAEKHQYCSSERVNVIFFDCVLLQHNLNDLATVQLGPIDIGTLIATGVNVKIWEKVF